MVPFSRYVLDNGLTVLIHEDNTTPLVGVNVLYNVGSRDETPDKTGFAHLFEHLMFGGSKNAPDFDGPLQLAGGENNAFTTTDHTNFYEIMPVENIETAFWLESDRMVALNISKKSLEVQRKVVVEEFKETCLNEPYGDCWHHLLAMTYQLHPYRWPVIGLVPEHIENASLEDVRSFFHAWYGPNNAVLTVAGNIKEGTVLELAQKWFGDIPARPTPKRELPTEAPLSESKHKVVEADVPVPAIYLAFPMPARLHPDFYAIDLLSDVMANGQSSRLYRRLLKEQPIFSHIDAYLTASVDPGLMVVEGKPAEGVSVEDALAAIWRELEQLKTEVINERELLKIKNRFESTVVFSELSAMQKMQSLAFYESLGDANLINSETQTYLDVSAADIHRVANALFQPNNCATLIYLPKAEKQ